MTTKPTFSIELEGLNETIEQHVKESVRAAIQSAFNDPIERKAYFSKGEAAQYLSVSRMILERLILSGLPVVQVQGRTLISRNSIDEFMKKLER